MPGSFKWYRALFGQPATLPAHDYFGQIVDSDGTVLLCLHEWGAHEHPSLMSPDHGTPGNGLLLFFRVDDFDLALQRARSLVTRLESAFHPDRPSLTSPPSNSQTICRKSRNLAFRQLICLESGTFLGAPANGAYVRVAVSDGSIAHVSAWSLHPPKNRQCRPIVFRDAASLPYCSKADSRHCCEVKELKSHRVRTDHPLVDARSV